MTGPARTGPPRADENPGLQLTDCKPQSALRTPEPPTGAAGRGGAGDPGPQGAESPRRTHPPPPPGARGRREPPPGPAGPGGPGPPRGGGRAQENAGAGHQSRDRGHPPGGHPRPPQRKGARPQPDPGGPRKPRRRRAGGAPEPHGRARPHQARRARGASRPNRGPKAPARGTAERRDHAGRDGGAARRTDTHRPGRFKKRGPKGRATTAVGTSTRSPARAGVRGQGPAEPPPDRARTGPAIPDGGLGGHSPPGAPISCAAYDLIIGQHSVTMTECGPPGMPAKRHGKLRKSSDLSGRKLRFGVFVYGNV